ncbi:expressed unknown protein [Seminavis robusta]|uniref:Uncharacterized protein n=1 Tax=Seminavis robusta TaxID=568900 RepID=A0A9N8HIP9_9STRA|nr:expressed unknown protein [Seminavis robusta]|eukprot:Sro712_g191400.1 n/a (126) ;mRNA; r:37076-37453
MKVSSTIAVAFAMIWVTASSHVSASETASLKKGLRGVQQPQPPSVARRAKKSNSNCAYDPVTNPIHGPCPPNSAAVFSFRACNWECKSVPATSSPAVVLPETGTGGSINDIQERSSTDDQGNGKE